MLNDDRDRDHVQVAEEYQVAKDLASTRFNYWCTDTNKRSTDTIWTLSLLISNLVTVPESLFIYPIQCTRNTAKAMNNMKDGMLHFYLGLCLELPKKAWHR